MVPDIRIIVLLQFGGCYICSSCCKKNWKTLCKLEIPLWKSFLGTIKILYNIVFEIYLPKITSSKWVVWIVHIYCVHTHNCTDIFYSYPFHITINRYGLKKYVSRTQFLQTIWKSQHRLHGIVIGIVIDITTTLGFNDFLLRSINQFYNFVKHIIFNKVVAYRLETCNFVKKCLARVSCIECFELLKRAMLQRKLLCWNLFRPNSRNKLDFRLAT